MRRRADGSGRQACTEPARDGGGPCGFRSLPGLVKGQGKCPYHWARFCWGKEWADHCYPPDVATHGPQTCSVCRVNAEVTS